jgi:uncharacterized protein YjbJ (UPF0337 family)
MSWQQIEGNWRQFIGEAKEKWGKLSDNDIREAEGNREILVGKLQQLYGLTPDKAGEEIAELERRLNESRKGAERMYGGA